jgi:hypothetical protein
LQALYSISLLVASQRALKWLQCSAGIQGAWHAASSIEPSSLVLPGSNRLRFSCCVFDQVQQAFEVSNQKAQKGPRSPLFRAFSSSLKCLELLHAVWNCLTVYGSAKHNQTITTHNQLQSTLRFTRMT